MANTSEQAKGRAKQPLGPNVSSRAPSAGAAPVIKRAAGRTLKEFGKLSEAERALRDACARGGIARVTEERPDELTEANGVRAAFLRFLLLGGDDHAPVHERGIVLIGAFITGELHLVDSTSAYSFLLMDCRFDATPRLSGARLRMVSFSGSIIPGLAADGIRIDGDLNFRSKFIALNKVSIIGATVTGDINCDGASFKSEEGSSFSADRAIISGSVFMQDVVANGEVRFNGAHIVGEFFCGGAVFERTDDYALNLDGARIDGSVFIGRGFRARGKVILTFAKVGNNIECGGGSFVNPAETALTCSSAKISGHVFLNDGVYIEGKTVFTACEIYGDLICSGGNFINPNDIAFTASRATIKGALFWDKLSKVKGVVSFDSARIGTLHDDIDSWLAADQLNLDGMHYGRIANGPTDAESRTCWLRKQVVNADKATFWPQPWEHLARVLREMGHVDDAKIIAIEKQKEMRRLNLIGSRPYRSRPWTWQFIPERLWIKAANLSAKALHSVYGTLAGYGYRPMRTVVAMAFAWAIATGVYSWGEARGLFGPTAAVLLTNPQFASCESLDSRWTRCPDLPRSYTTFDPPMYSLDVILPLVDLRQESDWSPIVRRGPGWSMWDGMLVRGVMWLEILFGWLTSLLLVSALGRLVQKD